MPPGQNETYDMLDPSSGKGGRGKLIVALLAILLAVGGVVGYYLYDRGRDNAVAGVAQNNLTGGAGSKTPGQGAQPGQPAGGSSAPGQPTTVTPSATPPASESTKGGGGTAASREVVHFALNDTNITDADAAKLDALASRAAGPGGAVTIEGHADSTGPEAHNLWLARARAERVADALSKKGLGKSFKLNVSGHGSSRPVAANDTDEGRAQNRRVEISVTRQ